MAHIQLKRHQEKDLLQTTGLVHEAFIRLAEGNKIQLDNREHFYALLSTMMCRILVENARRRLTKKRGGDVLVALKEECVGIELPSKLEPETLLSLDSAIRHLEKIHPRAARVVELKIFGEFENTEIAAVMGLSKATVKRAWTEAKQELFLFMARSGQAAVSVLD